MSTSRPAAERPIARIWMGALQAASIATGFPFAIVLMLMCVSIMIGLVRERKLHK